jgi:hypothetical protein
MQYQSVEEIFPLFKDEVNRNTAIKVYQFIMTTFEDIEIISLKSCISIARKGYIKFATISLENKNSLLLHFPPEIRNDLVKRKEEFPIEFERAKRDSYVNQINVQLSAIHNISDIYALVKRAYDNPRRSR